MSQTLVWEHAMKQVAIIDFAIYADIPAKVTSLTRSTWLRGSHGNLPHEYGHTPRTRRWLTYAGEERLIRALRDRAAAGEEITLAAMHTAIEQEIGHSITKGGLSKFMARHGWVRYHAAPTTPAAIPMLGLTATSAGAA